MASALDSLIQNYIPAIPHTPPAHALFSQRLGTAFIDVIMLQLFSQQTPSTLSNHQLQSYTQKFLTMMSQSKQVSAENLTQIVGRCITDCFAGSDLVQEIQEMTRGFLSQHQFANPPAPLVESSQSESSQSQLQYYAGDMVHAKKVLDYLTELEAPQSELQFLCKQMKWQWKISENLTEQHQPSAIAEIQFDFKDCKKTLRGIFVGKQKKLTKTVAVFKVLREVYLGYPEVWSKMEEIKVDQGIKFEKNPMNLLKFIPSEILNEKIEAKYPTFRREEEFFQNKEVYISQISNYRSQINLLIQHCPKIFQYSSQKEPIPGQRWRVKGSVTVNLDNKEKVFELFHDDSSSKLAQDVVAKRLVQAIYGEYVDIFHKMAAIKRKKCIRT